MQEPTFFILTALVREPLHGYGIMRAVEQLSRERIKLKAGTLYAALDRLTDQGLIVVEREEATAGRLRRYYALSVDGRSMLEAEVERMRANASVAAARLREAFGFTAFMARGLAAGGVAAGGVAAAGVAAGAVGLGPRMGGFAAGGHYA